MLLVGDRAVEVVHLRSTTFGSSTTSASTTSSSSSEAVGAAVARSAVAGRRGLLLRALVHRLGDRVERALQRLRLGVDRRRVVGLEHLADLLDRLFDPRLGVRVHLVAQLAELALGLVGRVLRVVAGLGQLARPAVLLGVRLGVGDHVLDFVVREPGARLDLDLLLLARPQVLRGDVEDAVRVDVERDLDLRDAARRRRDAGQLELAERLVVLGHLALALQDVDLDRRLVVLGRREDLALAGRDRRVALDQLRHHAALGLDAERQRRHVEQQHVLDVAGEHARLDRGADRHDLVGVDPAVGLLARELFDLLLHGRHARHAADQHHVFDRP